MKINLEGGVSLPFECIALKKETGYKYGRNPSLLHILYQTQLKMGHNCNCKNGESEVDARLQQAMDYCLEH